MHIILNHSSMVPIYEQLMEQIKTGIIESALAEGEALPSVRKLAGELRISALTVKKAYDKLEEAGFVTTVHGKGTFVAASDKQLAFSKYSYFSAFCLRQPKYQFNRCTFSGSILSNQTCDPSIWDLHGQIKLKSFICLADIFHFNHYKSSCSLCLVQQ